MNSLDLLLVGVNTLLIMVIYQIITKFWDYRTKQRLIKEGFIDEQSLDKIYYWNKQKERFNLIRTGIFTACIAVGLLVAILTKLVASEALPLVITVLFSISAGSFITMLAIKKIK